MSYAIRTSPVFERKLSKILKRKSDLDEQVRTVLSLLAENPFDRRLRTHKLKGKFNDCWACSIDSDLPIIFEFPEKTKNESRHHADELFLLTIGTHDEVY